MIYLELLVVLLLSLLNGLLAMSELAIISSRRARLKHLASVSESQKFSVSLLKEDPGGFLSTVQIGITLVGIFAGAFSGATLAARLGGWLNSYPAIAPHGGTIGMVVTVVAITYVSLILGELVPKRIALTNPERIAAAVAGLMRGISVVASPAVWLLKISTEGVLRFLGISTIRQSTVSEEEVKSMIAEGTKSGVFAPQEREMIEGVLRLADRPARIIMTPRSEIAWIDLTDPRQEIVKMFEQNRYSRLLVCDGDVDHPIGVVHTKDILPLALQCKDFDIKSLMKPALYVPESVSVLKLIERFKHKKLHVAVVVDEHGTTEGMITLTDVLESIAGDMPEYDEEAERSIVRRQDGSLLVDGDLPIDEFEARTGLTDLVKVPGVYTIAGFIMHRLETLPEAGMRFRHRNALFEVVDMDGRRIDKVIITIDPSHPSEDRA